MSSPRQAKQAKVDTELSLLHEMEMNETRSAYLGYHEFESHTQTKGNDGWMEGIMIRFSVYQYLGKAIRLSRIKTCRFTRLGGLWGVYKDSGLNHKKLRADYAHPIFFFFKV